MERELRRGEIYYVKFRMFFDKYIPEGKKKFVLILQEGAYFAKHRSVEILLISSDKDYKAREDYKTDVEIELGTTKLTQKSWALCAQPYPLNKDIFDEDGVWYAGTLSPEKMDEIDEALYNGLCMGLQNELDKEDALVKDKEAELAAV